MEKVLLSFKTCKNFFFVRILWTRLLASLFSLFVSEEMCAKVPGLKRLMRDKSFCVFDQSSCEESVISVAYVLLLLTWSLDDVRPRVLMWNEISCRRLKSRLRHNTFLRRRKALNRFSTRSVKFEIYYRMILIKNMMKWSWTDTSIVTYIV